MSDSELRDLERRFRESGSSSDETAWLSARVRSGDLARDRLKLAAYCGHPAAVGAVGDQDPRDPASVPTASTWDADTGEFVDMRTGRGSCWRSCVARSCLGRSAISTPSASASKPASGRLPVRANKGPVARSA